MPQVTVYIREEDLEAWKGVIKKSEFMHNALQDRSTYDGAKIVLREDIPWETSNEKVTTKPNEAVASVSPGKGKATPLNKQGKSYDLCKHGAIKGFCKKGCK